MTNERTAMLEPTDSRKPVEIDYTAHRNDDASLQFSDTFTFRHIGPDWSEISEMLEVIGCSSLDELIDQTIPASIRQRDPLTLDGPAADGRGEYELLEELRAISSKNQVFRSYIGMGYFGTITPPVIGRNILENPGWYTQYTPYQAEISQGRLEALLNFQTMVSDLTGLPIANASLLDEATAAAEAMAMCANITNRSRFLVAANCHPQTIEVVRTRAGSLGIEIELFDPTAADSSSPAIDTAAGVLVQYPTTDGRIEAYDELCDRVHAEGGLMVVATDLLALTLIRPPSEFGRDGADIAIGSAQRFGVPMGYGGPHAAFMACKDKYVRKMPGRLIGVSHDVHGDTAYRMAIQTREQHIKRDRATSNICTAQVLLAIMAGMYAVYHGPDGLRRIAGRVHLLTELLRAGLRVLGHDVDENAVVFDTLRVKPKDAEAADILNAARERRVNLRNFGDGTIGISLDETTTERHVEELLDIFGRDKSSDTTGRDGVAGLSGTVESGLPDTVARTSAYLTHPVFNTHHSETEMLRYIRTLESRDLSLCHSMIPLGSCTMKLNGTSEMIPITWPEFAHLHPFAPTEQAEGYFELFAQLERWLAEMTGFAAVSLQPNAGSQGEYAGLLAIRAYHEANGEAHRNICLIPVSAHGTNPASAVIAGMKVVAVKCDDKGNIDLADLKRRAEEHADNLAAIMITYPSTHGVFEKNIRDICATVHEYGGQVYLDGANLNAMLGLCKPADFGADVCHLNLHKTFCIPHGGGGPGMGPIGVAEHLKPFLPGHSIVSPRSAGEQAIGAIAAAPYGSPSILPISWMYIALMSGQGLTLASQVAILNANYMAKKLEGHYDVLYSGESGRVAHEFILDCRSFDKSAGIKIDDIARRLMDYGFHAPTMSWPVAGTLMIEPTESETKGELDRLCDALIAIREEIRAVEDGTLDREDNPLRNAPHTAPHVTADEWAHRYAREQAAYPAPWLREAKFWPHVGRIDQAHGDRNLFCTCPPVEEMN